MGLRYQRVRRATNMRCHEAHVQPGMIKIHTAGCHLNAASGAPASCCRAEGEEGRAPKDALRSETGPETEHALRTPADGPGFFRR